MGGLVRILQELPASILREVFMNNYLKMAIRIVSRQQADGLWRAKAFWIRNLIREERSAVPDFLCYALAWGVNNGLLKEELYINAAKKAWIGLNKCVNEEGRVGWVQPIGADPRKNFSADIGKSMAQELYWQEAK